MRADQLIVSLRKDQIADLRSRVNCSDWLEIKCVPESNMLISSASSCCKQASVKWTPVYGLDSSCMLTKLGQWSCRCTLSHIPDHQFVVISTRSEHCLIVRTPPQSTDFLHMAGKSLTLRLSLRSSDVTHLNGLIFAAASH